MNEYLEDFHRGDFLVRNLLGADPQSGVIAVNALPRAGQTVQFQRRDAAAATEDLYGPAGARAGATRRGGGAMAAACAVAMAGGAGCSARPHHDAKMVQEQLGPLGVAGFFCNGEIGPVGERNFLHGYTASLALFVKKI